MLEVIAIDRSFTGLGVVHAKGLCPEPTKSILKWPQVVPPQESIYSVIHRSPQPIPPHPSHNGLCKGADYHH